MLKYPNEFETWKTMVHIIFKNNTLNQYLIPYTDWLVGSIIIIYYRLLLNGYIFLIFILVYKKCSFNYYIKKSNFTWNIT